MSKQKTGMKLLSFLLTLALVVGLMPGMGLTAYAAEVESEEFTTNTGAGTYTGTHIKITGTARADADGDYIGNITPWTIQGLSGETITRVDMTIGFYGGDGNVSHFRANHGKLSNINDSNGGGFSFIDVNSTSITIDCESNENALQIKKVVVYYSAGSSSVAVTGVTLNPSTAQTIDVDGTVSFTATVEPNDATDKTVKWGVSGSAVTLYSDANCTAGNEIGTDATSTLTVYAKGISAGSATVTATSNADSTKSASCLVTVNAAHTHSFTYVAGAGENANTITATCGEGCDITEGLTLTISAPTGELTADGTTTFPATLSTGYNTTAFPGTYNITYTKNGQPFDGTPTDAGAYVASVTVGEDDGKATASVSYTVNKADPTANAPADLKAVCGQTLANVTLANPDGNTPGTWAWADDTLDVGNKGLNTFKATFTPEDTDNYNIIEDIDVSVNVFEYHDEVPAECEKDGVTAYYEDGDGSKFSDLGETALTDEQTVIEKLDHSFIHFLKWVWDGFNHAIAWLFCDNDPKHIETIDVPSQIDTVDEPTCTEDGYNYYVATIDVAGKTYTTVNVETVDQLGHKWKESEWNIDGTKASLTLVCENDPSHTKTVDAAVGVTVNEEGTLRTYTAKVTVDGVEYTKTWTEDITPDVPTPDVPTPDVPTPDVPTPDVPTPDEPTPDKPTPDEPTPDKPTPDEPTPDKHTPDEPTPDKPTPDEPTPDKPTPDEPEPSKEIKGILGDVNNDGQVDSADALLILRNSVGLEAFDDTQRFLGDVNEDNENIDSSDALAVLRYSVGLIDIEKIGTPVSKTVA